VVKRFGWSRRCLRRRICNALLGVGEVDAGRDGQDFQGADLPAAVSAVGVTVGVRDGLPGQGGELSVQAGLVLLHGEDPVRTAFGQVGDVLALAVQGVGGDDHIAQVADLIE
jgi:hypothetical protein